MKSKKEIEDWLRESLEPPPKTKKQEHEVQSEVDKLLEERLSEFKTGRMRPASTAHKDPLSALSSSPVSDNTSSPSPTLFTHYASPPRSAKRSLFLITAILAVCFAAVSMVIILTPDSKAASSPGTLSTVPSDTSPESRITPPDSSQISEDIRLDDDSTSQNPAGISTSDPDEASMKSPDPGTPSSPVKDEFLLEIEFPIPSLVESPLESPKFSDPLPPPNGSDLIATGRNDTPQRYTESSRSHPQGFPLPQAPPPVSTFTDEPSGTPVALETLDTPPKVLRRIQPTYPAKAFRRGIEGTVIINTLISESGGVLQTRVLRPIKGHFGFEKVCMEAIREWRFQPAVKDGENVKVWMPISITFKRK